MDWLPSCLNWHVIESQPPPPPSLTSAPPPHFMWASKVKVEVFCSICLFIRLGLIFSAFEFRFSAICFWSRSADQLHKPWISWCNAALQNLVGSSERHPVRKHRLPAFIFQSSRWYNWIMLSGNPSGSWWMERGKAASGTPTPLWTPAACVCRRSCPAPAPLLPRSCPDPPPCLPLLAAARRCPPLLA